MNKYFLRNNNDLNMNYVINNKMGNKQRIEKMKEVKYQKWKEVYDKELKETLKVEHEKHEKRKEEYREFFKNPPLTGIFKMFKSMTVHHANGESMTVHYVDK